MHESKGSLLYLLSWKSYPASVPTTSVMPDMTSAIRLNVFCHGLQLELHLPRRRWSEWEAGSCFPLNFDFYACLIVNPRPNKRKLALLEKAPLISPARTLNILEKLVVILDQLPCCQLYILIISICEDHNVLLRYVLGTRKLKFNLNLRTDRNENGILLINELENVSTSHQLHVHHLPVMYIFLNAIPLDHNKCS